MGAHDNDDHSAVLDFLTGFGIGALVAGAFALLYAPKSGAELRSDLRDKADDAKDAVERLLGDLRQRGERIIEDLKSAVEAGRKAAATKRHSLEDERGPQ